MLRFLLIVLSLTFLIAAPSRASEKDNAIHWLVWELSPEFIRNGPYAGRGYADRYLKFFIDNLPEYRHEVEWTNIKRWPREALKPGRCSPFIWGHFFRDRLVYSHPYTLTTPHVVVTHKRHRKRLGPEGTVLSLAELLKQKDLTFLTLQLYAGKNQTQPRYPLLHAYIAPHIGKGNVVELTHGTNEVDLRLIERGRADYALGYSTSIIAQQRDRGLGGDLISYDIEEHRAYKKIYVSCFGDGFGKGVVARINELLTPEQLERFIGYTEEWNGRIETFRDEAQRRIVAPVADSR